MKNEQINKLFNWPTDEDGNPMSLISISVSDLIPTAKYAHTTLGPATITKFVKDGTEGEAISEAYDIVDETLDPKREQIVEEVTKGNS